MSQNHLTAFRAYYNGMPQMQQTSFIHGKEYSIITCLESFASKLLKQEDFCLASWNIWPTES